MSIVPSRPTFIIEEADPVEFLSSEGSTMKSTASFICCGMSANFLGVGSPEILADVETIGRPKRCTRSLQKSTTGILMPTLPSCATVLWASPLHS